MYVCDLRRREGEGYLGVVRGMVKHVELPAVITFVFLVRGRRLQRSVGLQDPPVVCVAQRRVG